MQTKVNKSTLLPNYTCILKTKVTQSPTLKMLTSKTNKKHIQNNRLDERNHSHVNKETNKQTNTLSLIQTHTILIQTNLLDS